MSHKDQASVGWFHRHKHRIGLIAIGHTVKQIEEIFFDWIVYAAVVAACVQTWGLYRGSFIALVIMGVLSAVMCLLYLRLYDWSGKDWFGFEALKELRDEEKSGWWGKMLRRLLRIGGIPAFLLLSVNTDPFMTTVYLRHKSTQYQGLTRRDWNIFWASVFVSNLYWTLQWTVIIEVAKWVWRIVMQLVY